MKKNAGASPDRAPALKGTTRISHDQAFKNLILEYPREALLFYAESEAKKIDPSARITPIRQEQLKDRLGDRFFELDVRRCWWNGLMAAMRPSSSSSRKKPPPETSHPSGWCLTAPRFRS